MRSSYNPYTILSKSKKPEIISWLEKAKTLSEDQIRELKLKPDLQRAMIYVAQQQAKTASAGIAEHLADIMQHAHSAQAIMMQIWRYDGGVDFIHQNHITSIDVQPGMFFGVDGGKAFINNCWVPLSLNPQLLKQSVYIDLNDSTRLNQLNRERKNRQYV